MKKIIYALNRRMGIYCLIVLLVTGFTAPVCAQAPPDTATKFTPASLRQDFSVLRDSLEQLHPGLYRYQSKKEMDAVFDDCYRQLDHPMTDVQYFAVISYLVSHVKDGHTSTHLPNAVTKQLISGARLFPVKLRFIGDQAFVPCDTRLFPAGTEILAINNEPVKRIRKKLFDYLPSDGNIQSGKYYEMNDGDSPFFFEYYLVYGSQPNFSVGYRTADGKRATIKLEACLFRDVAGLTKPVVPDKYLRFENKGNGVAVLTVSTFLNDFLRNKQEDFAVFMQNAFMQVTASHISNLIIDLRGNAGGNDENGALLYSYLTDQPFRYQAGAVVINKSIEKQQHPLSAVQQPQKNNYDGKVIFLTNGKSFSATSEFCAVARSHQRGIFVGEETGGGYDGDVSGFRTTVILPNTKINVNIPETEFSMAVQKAKHKGRGILPDHVVVPAIANYLNHRDVQMEYAQALCQNK